MIAPGEIKLLMPPRRTLASDRQTGQPVPVWEFVFSIRGEGQYSATVPIVGFTPELAQKAIEMVAEPMIKVMDMYK